MEIAVKMLTADQYRLTGEAHELLMQCIQGAVRSRSESFANARWMEQFVRNGIVPALASRICSRLRPLPKSSGGKSLSGNEALPQRGSGEGASIYQLIEDDDVRSAAAFFSQKNIAVSPRPAIGFCA